MLIDNIQDIDGNVEVEGNIDLNGHILPDITGGSGFVSLYNLGSSTQKFNTIYADELFLGASSLYVNDKKVIEDVSDTMTFATDVDQSMVLNTYGTGGLTLKTADAILKMQSTANEVNIDGAGGIEAAVGATLPNKHMNFTNQSLGGNITFTATGTSSNVQLNAASDITLIAPDITLTGTIATDNIADLDSVVSGLITHDHNSDYYTKAEVSSLHSTILSGIDWKEAVTNFADLATTYTSPEEGWTASVNSEDTVYRYNGSAWVALANGTVPLATGSLAGKLSASDFTKLQGIETSADANMTASELLTAIKTVDGGSSGLDVQYLGGKPLQSTGNNWNTVPHISTGGVMEIGRYIDFHAASDTDTDDYDWRIMTTNNGDFAIYDDSGTYRFIVRPSGTLYCGSQPVNTTDVTNKAYVDGSISKNANGYAKLPGGLIIQWGVSSSNGGIDTNITFPTTFSACRSVTANHRGDAAIVMMGKNLGHATFTVRDNWTGSHPITFHWTAIGY